MYDGIGVASERGILTFQRNSHFVGAPRKAAMVGIEPGYVPRSVTARDGALGLPPFRPWRIYREIELRHSHGASSSSLNRVALWGHSHSIQVHHHKHSSYVALNKTLN